MTDVTITFTYAPANAQGLGRDRLLRPEKSVALGAQRELRFDPQKLVPHYSLGNHTTVGASRVKGLESRGEGQKG